MCRVFPVFGPWKSLNWWIDVLFQLVLRPMGTPWPFYFCYFLLFWDMITPENVGWKVVKNLSSSVDYHGKGVFFISRTWSWDVLGHPHDSSRANLTHVSWGPHEGRLVALWPKDLDLIFDTIRGKTKSVAVVLTPHVLKRTESDRVGQSSCMAWVCLGQHLQPSRLKSTIVGNPYWLTGCNFNPHEELFCSFLEM